MRSSIRNGVIISLLCAIAYGIYPPASQKAYADGANSIFVIIVSTFCRAFIMAIMCWATRQSLLPRRTDIRPILTGGFFQSLSIFGIIASLEYIPGPIMITIVFTHTIMLLFFMAFRGEAKLSTLAVTTTLCALFGIALVVDVFGNFGGLNLIGVGLAFMAALATTSRLYVYGQQVKSTSPPVLGTQVFSVAFIFILVLPFFRTPTLPHSLAGFGWLGLSSLSLSLGTLGMFYGISMLGSFRYSLLLKLEPVCTAIFSILILGEVLAMRQYVGMALVIVSLGAFQYLSNRSVV